MAPDVVFRKRASADLANLFDYLNALNPSAAQSYVAAVRSACLALSDFPERARRYDDRPQPRRFLPLRGRSTAVIARIIDGRRNMEAILRTARSP
ncbi:type II toxin-antitoxin system RelE/ParE family toxin [Mesorhizobium camelthorni]|uniref:Type II toxin-antitoxin system RelE/ParE family toxin n=1 Tax=Allomesorhizobium camelthorni TaxID=475069 RepID=A0A6G4WKM3_9HYPH|nr:type II toxin-antitoxin system RelE/ParE family toxin [Mesorhizobium camelthorni]